MTVRTKSIITTLIATILFLFTQRLVFILNILEQTLLNKVLLSVGLSVIIFLLISWVIKFNLKNARLYTIAIFPALFIFVFSIFGHLSLLQLFLRVIGGFYLGLLTTLFALIVYTLTLNTNLLLTSKFVDLPLERAAKTIVYIFCLLFVYLSMSVILSLDTFWMLKIILSILVSIITLAQAYSTLNITRSQLFNNVCAILPIFICLNLIIFLIPSKANYIALFVTSIYYTILGVGLEDSSKITLSSKIEYLAVIVLTCIFMLYTSSWGIAGSLI